MDIISADEIRRSGATDLPTILSRVAGVDIQAWSAGHADVGVRGYNQARSARLLVLVNGRQAYLDHYGYTAWSTLPVRLEEIRQIEVVKGPNSALFGFNAVAGVVNIITVNGYEGLKVSGKYGITDEGDGQDVNFDVLWGIKNDRGSVTAALTSLSVRATEEAAAGGAQLRFESILLA